MVNCPTENQIVLLYAAVTPELSARILKERIKMLWHKNLLHLPGKDHCQIFNLYFQLQNSEASVHGYFLTWKLKLGSNLFSPIYLKIFIIIIVIVIIIIIIINYYYCCCCCCTFATIYNQQLTKIQSEEKLKPKKKTTKRNNLTTPPKKQEQKRTKYLGILRFTNFALIRSVS